MNNTVCNKCQGTGYFEMSEVLEVSSISSENEWPPEDPPLPERKYCGCAKGRSLARVSLTKNEWAKYTEWNV